MRSRRLTPVLVVAALCALSPVGALARPSARHGLAGVRAASVRQHGRRLIWRVSLVHGLSVGALADGRRSLCLLVAGRSDGAGGGELCLAKARAGAGGDGLAGGRGLGLTFAPGRVAGLGRAHPVAGTVVRRSAARLSASFTPAALHRGYRSLRWQTLSGARGAGCPGTVTDPGQTPGTCVVDFPARRRPLARLHTPRLVGCVAHGPPIVDGGPPSRREVALTFDDGPWDDPPSIDFVDTLHRLHAPATFFEIGDQISEFDPTGAVERAMLADGDTIGDHTWTHPDMDALAPAEQRSELELTAQAIRQATGFTPCLWRPPYGSIDAEMEQLAGSLGFETVYWDDDPRDWSLPGTAAIVDTALSEARDGAIVEMHFGGGPRGETLAALPTLVADLRARGYRLVNLATLLGVRELWR